eukprot:jgi/Undpi1/4164/HiC_scaffold_16.g07531.m1
MDNEMTPETVQQEEKMIRLLLFQKNDTKAIHRTVERDGLILGPRGKQQVSGCKHYLALIVVVDKENYTRIAMQALLANERSEDFELILRVFRELNEGAQPQVIFTDGDPAAMATIPRKPQWGRHKLCLFLMDENVRKHGKGLGEGVLAGVIRMFHKAVFAPTEELFLLAKQDLFKLLTPGSHMYTYMAEYVFGPT